MKLHRLIFGRVTAGTPAADFGLLLLRLVAGLALAFAHGTGKVPPAPGFIARVGDLGFPAPALFAWLAAVAEFVGGLLLAFGLLTRPAALFIVGHFAFVIVVAHAGDSFGDREKPILFAMIALLYLLAGPGRYSLDALIGGRRM